METKMAAPLEGVDRGWAWMVLAACFLSNVMNAYFTYAAGVLNVALLAKFNENVAFTALVGSVFASLLSLTGPISSSLVTTTNCRVTHLIGSALVFIGFSASYFVTSLNVLLVTYGICAGSGTGLVAASILIKLGYSFDRYQGIAVGVAVAGSGLGMFLSGPLTQFLLDTYSLNGAFLFLGGLSTQGFVFAIIMRPCGRELLEKAKRDESNTGGFFNSFDFSIIRNTTFMVVLFSNVLWNLSYSILLVHLTNFAVTEGSTPAEGAWLITMIGVGSIFNRILTGLSLGKKHGLDPLLMQFGFLGLSGLITVIFPLFSGTYKGQCVFAVIFGFHSGGMITLITPLVVHLAGVSQVAAGVGGMYLSSGIGGIIGPPLAGALFILAAFFVLISAIWRNELEEEVEHLDIKESNILGGSALFLAGSMSHLADGASPSIARRTMGHSKHSLLLDDVLRTSHVSIHRCEFHKAEAEEG
ncbi:monocarboxylate transporter 4-like isoform X2 [Mizuhopecten yessoensis]|uniref:monocarboxylate transporter 4-like isoform X2 n=1 Tax=Mizuhopecten yessoensis TaxID=6573 RepID=UPI000B45F4A8|nr:monocarboxylate transporter 4-like isoform X2 [Mizuhopecten yessoensis]